MGPALHDGEEASVAIAARRHLATRPRPCEVSQTLPAPAYSTFCVPLWNLEDKACCRRMRDQPISCIGDASLRGGDAAAGIEHAALGADDAARLAHAAHE